MQEKNTTNPGGEKQPGEGKEWPKPEKPGIAGKQGGDGDFGKLGDNTDSTGDNRKSGDPGKQAHE